MTHDTLPRINLIPVAQRRARQRSLWVSRWTGMVSLTAVLIGVPGLYIGGSAAFTDSGMNAQIQDARAEVVSHQQVIPQLQARLRQLSAEQEVLDLVKNRVDWRDVFDLLVKAAGGQTRFTSLRATGGGVDGSDPIEIMVGGIAPSQTGAREYVVALESTGVFDRVELIDTARQRVGDSEMITFRLRITVRGKGARTGGGTDGG